MQYYYKQTTINRASPPLFKQTLGSAVRGMWNEIRYYDRLKAEEDVRRIQMLYYQHGYHNATATFKFKPNKDFTGNILLFEITERERYKISNINFLGLDGIPPDVREKIEKVRKVKIESGFNEVRLATEVDNIRRVLLDNGYYFANYSTPIITVDTLSNSDSITVKFSTGIRQKVREIIFVDSTKGQRLVVYNLKYNQMDLRPGDWYSKRSEEISYNNLLTLGTFDMVVIDTVQTKGRPSDSTLTFRVFSQYRKQQDYSLALFSNKTIYNSAVNIGVEYSYTHRNIFHAAQMINPFIRLVVEDVNLFLSNSKKLELEYQMGLNYSQVLAWTWDVAKIGFSTQILLSYRTVFNTLKILSFSLPVKFPIRLPSWTYFNQMSVDFFFERQQPYNLWNVLEDMNKKAKTHDDSSRVFETLTIFSNLDSFIIVNKPLLTANILGCSFIGDTRNNPFSPSNGGYSSLTIDGINPIFYAFDRNTGFISGAARYAKIQLTNLWFWSLEQKLVMALKQREGYIYWWDKSKSYVPFERQFFAGGANSIRGWQSRQLRYTKPGGSTAKGAAEEFAKDFVGNAGLIEGSLEFRYSFGKPTYVGGTIADIISSLGVTGFIDWGNAYQWLQVDEHGNYPFSYKIADYFQGIALAVGFGVRYDTPVGPFRIDIGWPVYDPNKVYTPFSNTQINIGLGHAF